MAEERQHGELAYKVSIVDEYGKELFDYQAFCKEIDHPEQALKLMNAAVVKLSTFVELARLGITDLSEN